MKWCRLLCVIFFISVISGCNTKNVVIPVLTNLQFTAQIEKYNESYSCQTNIDANGVMKIKVNAPELIEGMLLTFDESGVTAQYKGITYTPKTESMPIGNVAQLMYVVFNDLSNNTEISLKDRENCKIIGRTNDKEYTFTYSPAGLPLTLEIPDDGFKITFEDVTVMK